jgi:hypothetical protein
MTHKKAFSRSVLLAAVVACVTVRAADVVNSSTLDGKVLFGYQGWFNCGTDGQARSSWRSWARGVPSAATLTIDMYPDLSEFDKNELCEVPDMTIGGKPAYLFSTYHAKTVLRHFQWMKDYGLDGVLVQRFVGDIKGKREGGDVLLKHIMAAAAKTGRTFAIEYDISGGRDDTFFQILRDDWAYLVNDLKVTSQRNYLRHQGKPVLSIWGIGLNDGRRPPRDPELAKQVVRWFKSEAPVNQRVIYMGGTASRWRILNDDAFPEPGWAEVYKMMDVVQPWTPGRYRDIQTIDKWKADMIEPDLALAKKNNQMYMPVIFPGFSWYNLNRKSQKNSIPRNRGEFLWHQAYNAKLAGARVLKIAMFDEVNESTAMFKVVSHRNEAPDQGYWLTLDADGHDLPSDWYLRLAGEITKGFHGQIKLTPKLPEKPGPPAKSKAGK